MRKTNTSPAGLPSRPGTQSTGSANDSTYLDAPAQGGAASLVVKFGRSRGPVSNLQMVSCQLPFSRFCDMLSQPTIGPKDGSYFVRGQLLPGTARGDQNMTEAWLIVLDGDATLGPSTGKKFEGAPDPALVHEVLKTADIAHFIFTTHSHADPKKGIRWRAVIPLSSPIKNKAELARCVDYLIDLLHQNGVWLADVSENKSWSQAWFLPRCPEERLSSFKTFRHMGRALEASAIIGTPSPADEGLTTLVEMPCAARSGPIAAFNETHGIEWMLGFLQEYGYRRVSESKINGHPSYRFISPRSESRMPGVTLYVSEAGKPLAFSHHGNHDRLNADGLKKSHDAFDMFTIFEHDGNQQAALAAIAPDTPGAPDKSESDLGNAARFVAEHGTDLRYVAAWGWLTWIGTHWGRDQTGEATRRAKGSIRGLVKKAFALDSPADQNRLLRFALRSQARQGIENALKLAQTEAEVVALPEQFDCNPMVLNVQNGTLDLKTGTLHPHRRADLLTKILSVDFDQSAQCPTWIKFLQKVTGNDQELCSFLQKAVGYSLTGSTNEQCLFYLFGHGRNGKSVFIETLSELFGRYARRISSESLMVKPNGGGIPNDIAALAGARLVVSSEVEEGSRLNETRIKELTGSDTVSARFLHQEFFEFKPAFKLWIAGNHKPIIRGTDLGIWRRIRLIPFAVTIPESEVDPNLPAKLRAEFPGILAWAVEGCRAWQRTGLMPARAVVQATNEYRTESDLIGLFLEEACILDASLEVQARALYAAYRSWIEAGGGRAMTSSMLTRKLGERGFETRRGHATNILGIGLRMWEPPAPG
ncbi:MAG: hypothetical protein HQL87_03235 [Magnetococcales bacterium]|nr:hypothetical protein [Magnetococcales bacterium]